MPLPVPLLPLVIVIHPALLEAVQAQPLLLAVTAVVADAPPATTVCDAGDAVKLQTKPSCVTANVCPATVSEPDRGPTDVFAATVNPTVPLFVPLLPLVIVIQLALLVAVHAQPLDVVTAVEDEAPAATMLAEVGDTE